MPPGSHGDPTPDELAVLLSRRWRLIEGPEEEVAAQGGPAGKATWGADIANAPGPDSRGGACEGGGVAGPLTSSTSVADTVKFFDQLLLTSPHKPQAAHRVPARRAPTPEEYAVVATARVFVPAEAGVGMRPGERGSDGGHALLPSSAPEQTPELPLLLPLEPKSPRQRGATSEAEVGARGVLRAHPPTASNEVALQEDAKQRALVWSARARLCAARAKATVWGQMEAEVARHQREVAQQAALVRKEKEIERLHGRVTALEQAQEVLSATASAREQELMLLVAELRQQNATLLAEKEVALAEGRRQAAAVVEARCEAVELLRGLRRRLDS